MKDPRCEGRGRNFTELLPELGKETQMIGRVKEKSWGHIDEGKTLGLTWERGEGLRKKASLGKRKNVSGRQGKGNLVRDLIQKGRGPEIYAKTRSIKKGRKTVGGSISKREHKGDLGQKTSLLMKAARGAARTSENGIRLREKGEGTQEGKLTEKITVDPYKEIPDSV